MVNLRVVFFIVAACFSQCAPAASDPEMTVRKLYSWALSDYRYGIPSESALIGLSGVLGPELVDLLRQVGDFQNRCAAKFPRNMKPPFVERSLFSTEYERASEVVVGDTIESDGRAMVVVDLIYINDALPKASPGRATRGVAEISLRRIEESWVIADFVSGNRSLVRSMSEFLGELEACVSEL